MGRHAVMSSPLRSPAVLVGVPVATVLATFGTTAFLGGVVPSAQEAPLRAEAPDAVVGGTDVLVPVGAPSAPAVSLDAPLHTTALTTTPTEALDPGGSTGSTASAASARTVAGPRVVRLGPAAPVTVTPDRGHGPRVVEVDRGSGDDGTWDGGSDGASGSSGARRAPNPTGGTSPSPTGHAVTAASPAATAASRVADAAESPASGEDDDGDALLDVGSPSGGLSVLSFG